MLPGCLIRNERPADRIAIADVTRLAFGGRQVEVDMVAEIRESADYLSLVAELSGEIVGHCILRRRTLAGEAAPPVLQLGPLSVHPDWQRRGIGSELVVAAQAAASKRAKEELIVLLGVPDYYPRFGFRPAREFGMRPDGPAAMVFPLVEDVSKYRGTKIPTG